MTRTGRCGGFYPRRIEAWLRATFNGVNQVVNWIKIVQVLWMGSRGRILRWRWQQNQKDQRSHGGTKTKRRMDAWSEEPNSVYQKGCHRLSQVLGSTFDFRNYARELFFSVSPHTSSVVTYCIYCFSCIFSHRRLFFQVNTVDFVFYLQFPFLHFLHDFMIFIALHTFGITEPDKNDLLSFRRTNNLPQQRTC